MDGPFKLQKIPFVSQLAMNTNHVKGFSYSFFQYLHGPMSKEIYADAKILYSAGLTTGLKDPILLTDEARDLFGCIADLYNENREILAYIDDTTGEYAALDFGTLKRKVYGLEISWTGQQWRIAEIPEFTDVITKLDPREATRAFRISEGWLDSLWGSLNYTQEQKRKLSIIRRAAS